MKGTLYKMAYKFKDQVVFTVEFKGEEDLSDEELEGILLEQAAIMRGERVGIIKERILPLGQTGTDNHGY